MRGEACWALRWFKRGGDDEEEIDWKVFRRSEDVIRDVWRGDRLFEEFRKR